ncbi:MAG: FAD-dependent oxidoreductase, partial [Chloroflexi bacterium]|nr:FAD-dependent oxidoreductase [Chloroflexota bacterium]
MTPTRDETRQVLRDGAFDVLVIGAGITGAGIALDAAARGLSVAVLDKGDVASGTSGWSTKLVHGGVRYLEQYDFPMVREGLHERYTLLQNAPYLVRRLGFLYPVAGGPLARAFVDTGLWFYDLLAGRRSLGLHHRV